MKDMVRALWQRIVDEDSREATMRGALQLILSFRGDAKLRTRNLEIPGLVLRTIPE